MKILEIRDRLDELINEFGPDLDGCTADPLQPEWRNTIQSVDVELGDKDRVVFVAD
jgi:hypothetical protein